jgi:multiple sugar transport system permease protein
MSFYLLQKRTGQLFHWVLALFFLVIAVFPIYWMINVVFSPEGIPVSLDPRLYPSSLSGGIAKIKDIFFERGFLNAYYVSFIYAGATVLLSITLTSMAAYEFGLYDFPGKRFLFAFAMFALIMPKTVSMIPLYLTVTNKFNWLNTFKGLIIPGLADVFGLFMLRQFIEQIPKDLIDAARVDGASHFSIYYKIVLPLSKNAIFTLAILIFNRTWGQLTWPMIIEQEQNMYTVSRIINWFNQPDTWVTSDSVMAANFMAAIPPLIVFLFFQNYVMKGVAYTGIKG